MRDLPRKFKHRGHCFQLVLKRWQPHRKTAAIYAGPLILNRGKLSQDFVIIAYVRSQLNVLDTASDLPQALQQLFYHQHKLPQGKPFSLPSQQSKPLPGTA